MNPARYCATRECHEHGARDLQGLPARPASAGGRQAAALALGVIPDLFDEALVALDAELDHDIDQQIEQVLDVRAGSSWPPRLCLTRSTSCSKASSALAAWTLVIEPGWPELTFRR